MPAPQFYPALNKLISSDQLPAPIKSGVDSIFSKLFYKSYYVEKSVYGDTAYHHLVLIFDKVGFNLFGGDDGFEIIFNPGEAANTTEIPISLYYNLPIAKYVREIKLENLSTVEDYFNLILEMFNINKNDLLYEVIGAFLSGNDNPVQSFVDDFNSNPLYSTYTPLSLVDASNGFEEDFSLVQDLIQQFEDNNLDIKEYLLENYLNISNITAGIENLSLLFKKWMGEFSLETIMNLFIPKFSVSVDVLEVALAFPRKWLTPVDPITLEVIADESVKAMLVYNVGSVAYNSETGFEFINPDNFDLTPCQIGNTGIIIEIEDLTFDFKNDENIPQADADGRPLTFKGIYVETANIILPKKWFKIESGATLQISGKQLLVGTEGGVSGTIALETIIQGNPITETDFMWFKLGGDNGFRIGFNSFDITFKQNKVISSNIRAGLEIKKFVYPGTQTPVKIDVEGHIHDNGDFNLTASVNPGFPIELAGILKYDIRSLELGKEDDDFYIGTSGKLQFLGVPLLENLEAIEIDRLRIYSDGSIEIQGGSVHLAKPIILPLGPVEITISAIHYGSHQKEVDGVMRKFNYFGFDGGISINPLGVEIRGDGVKYYYCVDDLPNKPHAYLHIQTLYIDLTIPASSPVVIINGWLSIPEPGTSPEYAGGIKIKIPKAKISGGAEMKLAPRYPAFIIDAEIELPVPIPLGTFAIYGFRGLIGYRYVAEKEAIGLVSGVNTWYEYYTAPTRGINVRKFNGPNRTKRSGTPVSLGAGASLGTSPDDGTILNIKAMVLLSIPSLFMIDGRASVLSARLGLDDSGEPPFFAFVALGDNSLEFGFGADFKLPTSSGSIFSLYADLEAGFFFKDSSKWYVNFGTKTNPVTARIVSLITLKSFLMLSAKGIEAGARGEFIFNKTYGPIKVAAWAYVEVGGKISFERPQFGSYIAAGVGAEIDIKILHLYIAIDLLFGAEASKPMLIYGKFRLCVKIKILFIKIKFCGEVEIAWDFNSTVDRTPINPLVSATVGELAEAKIAQLVKGVNMLTNDTFELAFLTPAELNTVAGLNKIKSKIIPLDTYIDIKSEKGLLPGSISNIGGLNNPPERYTDLVPPDAMVRGKMMRQVKHQYKIDAITVKSWNGAAWTEYNPYKALYPDDATGTLANMKIGQWQKIDGQYNTIRLLATTPFSYTEQGEPGWHIPEQYGITSGSLFCQGANIEMHCANFLTKPLGHHYYCYDTNNHFFYANEVAFVLLDSQDDEFAAITNEVNVFDFAQSLSFPNNNKLQITLPQPSAEIAFKLTTFGDGVWIKYYAVVIDDSMNQVQFGHPNQSPGFDFAEPFKVFYTAQELANAIVYSNNVPGRENWKPIVKIVIEPVYPNSDLIHALQEQIAQIEENNYQILIGNETGNILSTLLLENQLEALTCVNGKNVKNKFVYDSQDNVHTILDSENQPTDWIVTWDWDLDHKPVTNEFGFRRISENEIKVESKFEILNVKFLPFSSDPSSPLFPPYEVIYNDKTAIIRIDDYPLSPYPYLDYSDSYDIEIISFYPKDGCGDTNQEICAVYDQIKDIFFTNFQPVFPLNFSIYGQYAAQITQILKNKNYFGNNELLQYSNIVGSLSPPNTPTEQTYFDAYTAIENILNLLNSLGNCVCKCDDTAQNTLLHEVCWLSLEEYEYNINIPSQEAIEADTQATIAGLSKYIQPIWRPDTSYLVQFKLKDIVDNGLRVQDYDFAYGFSTAGPVGFFHTHEHSTYGDIQLSPTTILDDTTGIVRDNNGVVILPNREPHPDKYQLTSLRQYIDYQRSYPNADGNLLSAKPLFYGDGDNTKISLYFTKAYATHFFQEWQNYAPAGNAIKSKLKIVIKDPREDVLISNPPSLDDIITTVDVPQTIETWTDETNPLIPFVLSQWINMYQGQGDEEHAPCVLIGADPIIPPSKFVSVELHQLKPQKLYTAIVNGMFDLNKDGELGPIKDPNNPTIVIHQEETKEIHKFVFQTSRYRNFDEQVNSYLLYDDDGNSRQAIFTIEKTFTQAEIDATFKTIKSESISGILSDAEVATLNLNYQHPFDRVVEGILKLSPINTAISTEFNFIKNAVDNKINAVLIKNPEPFNNPKIPVDKILNSIQVLKWVNIGEEESIMKEAKSKINDASIIRPQRILVVDTSYSALHSKDYSQAILMKNSLSIVGSIIIQFNYKTWNAEINDYQDISSVLVSNIQIS